MADLTNFGDFQAASDQNRVEFLRSDLGLCFTFADLAKTERETGDREAAHRILEKAETGYATITRFLADVENADQKSEIEQTLTELRVRLDAEEALLRTHPAE